MFFGEQYNNDMFYSIVILQHFIFFREQIDTDLKIHAFNLGDTTQFSKPINKTSKCLDKRDKTIIVKRGIR